jgi:hypothetical protein
MKVKALSRSKAATERECVGDLRKHQRNLDPVYHPMQRSREMARAVTSAKMERMVSSFTLLSYCQKQCFLPYLLLCRFIGIGYSKNIFLTLYFLYYFV